MLFLFGCGNDSNTYIRKELIHISPGVYLKEIVLNDGFFSSTRYIYIVVNAEGEPIHGAGASYQSGKITRHTSTALLEDDTEYRYYQLLKKKYERAEE
jgi:hypothetical protein